MMKNSFLIILIMSFSCAVIAQDLKTDTDNLAKKKEIINGRFSFYALNKSTGKTIIDKNKNDRMIPASTLKLLTGYSALDLLGKDHQFTTQLMYSGKVDAEGKLLGDIVVIGGGDPVFGSANFADHYEKSGTLMSQFSQAIKEAGIKSVDGKVIVDDSYYGGEPLPVDWVWQDVGNYYGAGSHSLSYQENMYEIYLNSEAGVDELVSVDETSKLLHNLNYSVKAKGASINSDQVYVYSPPYADYAILRGKMPLSRSKFKIKAAVPDPGLLVSQLLAKELRNNGVSVKGQAMTYRSLNLLGHPHIRTEETMLLEVKSPKLLNIVNYMNLKSNNLIAEHLVKQISKIKGEGIGSTDDGLKTITGWLRKKGIYDDKIRLKDGSGLSHTNLVTASWFVTMLTKMSEESWFDQVMSELPTAGKTGSMRRVGKGSVIENKMKAKTGYIDGVRGYVGYVPNAKNELIVFAIIANDYAFSASAMRKEIAKLLIQLQ
ncbi:MAG: D-alanyl-D-alanine carboxypeptidase/D-alanyl-D-alanine-endopeptidase (penicillin-binding protein 4) [Gammaproteobacteria bacterium]|jgi:D-alanyl-D-alanine carboxypeptidase/D-alanyl-D-alanine-endopeptidase (penicillin-binding protein 4)